VLLVHAISPEFGAPRSRLTHVGSDGAVGTLTIDARRVTAARVADGTVRLYGAELYRSNRTFVGTVDTAALPGVGPDPTRNRAPLASNATAYRGQNLRFAGAADLTYGLYRLPGEYTEFDRPRLTRRLRAGPAGTVSFETATLSAGSYAIRIAGGFWLELDGGEGAGVTTNASTAAFELDREPVRIAPPTPDRRGPLIGPAGPNRTVVETFRGERGVRVRVEADRDAFTARVGLTRLNGSTPSAGTLRTALSADPQFRGMAADVADRPFGAIRMPAGGDRNVTLDTGALPAGLYRLSVRPRAAADATEPATTRVVVVTEQREVSLSPADTSLTVPRGGEATTNLTLSGVEAGVRAVRIEAVRTGGPPVGLGIEFTEALETWSSAGGSVVSLDRSSADRESLAVDRSPTGSFAVARLSVRNEPTFVGADATGLGNDTLTVELA
jgi:hypothetical protein